eukprot:Hpha_TRINITY_DN6974_c0_g1::TRINITY_DN6974_c0_g1_i1::g.139625::m.139625
MNAEWWELYQQHCEAAALSEPGASPIWAWNKEYQSRMDGAHGLRQGTGLGEEAAALEKLSHDFAEAAKALVSALSEGVAFGKGILLHVPNDPSVASSVVRNCGLVASRARLPGRLFGVTTPLCCAVRVRGTVCIAAAISPLAQPRSTSPVADAVRGIIADALCSVVSHDAVDVGVGADGRCYAMPFSEVSQSGLGVGLVHTAVSENPQVLEDRRGLPEALRIEELKRVAECAEALRSRLPVALSAAEHAEWAARVGNLVKARGLRMRSLGKLYNLSGGQRTVVAVEMLARTLRRLNAWENTAMVGSQEPTAESLTAAAAAVDWKAAAGAVGEHYGAPLRFDGAELQELVTPAVHIRLETLLRPSVKTTVGWMLRRDDGPDPAELAHAASLSESWLTAACLNDAAALSNPPGVPPGKAARQALRRSVDLRFSSCGKKFLRDAEAPVDAARDAARGVTTPVTRVTLCCRERVVTAWRACAGFAWAVDAFSCKSAPRVAHRYVLLLEQAKRSTRRDEDSHAAEEAAAQCRMRTLLARALLGYAAAGGGAGDAAAAAEPARAAVSALDSAFPYCQLVRAHSAHLLLEALDLVARASAAGADEGGAQAALERAYDLETQEA